ncbi:MAG: hypothetical protein HY644_15530 [Acidobacteria bacterium]|nr:hypothetical protein [Acidobacteriota bacterium]
MRAFQVKVNLALLFITACALHRPISEIEADPARYSDKSTTIEGKVTQSYGVWKYGVYQLEDSSGSIWVIASRPTPANGSRIAVKGRARSAFNLPFIKFTGTVFQEEDRKTRGF